jgi:RHS repeat-associated protein
VVANRQAKILTNLKFRMEIYQMDRRLAKPVIVSDTVRVIRPSARRGLLSVFRESAISRCLSAFLIFAFVTSFLTPIAAEAAQQTVQKSVSVRVAQNRIAAVFAKSKRLHMAALTIPRQRWDLKPRPTEPQLSSTLLTDIGYLAAPVPVSYVSEWKRELGVKTTGKQRAAQLHLWLGEYALAKDEAPELAQSEFDSTKSLTTVQDPLYGLATYDTAVASFYEGAYRDSADSFHELISPSCRLTGYNSFNCARFYKYALSCANYHTERSRAGIPEPPILDPRCAAAALATCLQALKLPSSEASTLKKIRMTGEGSNLEDIVVAANKLGLKVHTFGADEQGLIEAPKPLVAYVERDHFVAVTKADKNGVTYLCSDCGAWPGGEVHLNWGQWKMLDTSIYASIVKPGSFWDTALSEAHSLPVGRSVADNFNGALSTIATASRVRVATIGSLAGLTGLRAIMPTARLIADLRAHLVFGFVPSTGNTGCGTKPGSMQCPPYIICCWSCSKASGDHNGNPSAGDPVNLASGEEEYSPPSDLDVYNPIGPSISWSRIYNSLRPAAMNYEADDYGAGWSTSYNFSVDDPSPGTIGTKYIQYPNGGQVALTATAVPSPSNKVVPLGVTPGMPLIATWNYTAAGDYYDITTADRTLLVMNEPAPLANGAVCYAVTQVIDRNNNALLFNYSAPAWHGGWPLLSSIGNINGTLLTINRAADGTGNITSITDCYGRSVYYHAGVYPNTNVPTANPQSYQQLDWVSQIVPSCSADLPGASTPPGRYAYGYVGVENGDKGTGAGETVPLLSTISVPSPTGSGTNTATISYDGYFVGSTTDGNGYVQTYTPVLNADSTQVTVTGGNMNAYTYAETFASNMSFVSKTNGLAEVTTTYTYNDPSDPYEPSTITDGLAHTTNFSYDVYGNVTTETSARNTQSIYTYSHSNFEIGELTEIQPGSNLNPPKTPTTITYNEPSGLIASVTEPAPQSVHTGSGVTYSYTYNTLGDLTSVTSPGNNAVGSVTETLAYGSSPHVGQVQSATDNLGNTSTFTYDNQGNLTSTTDAAKNTTYFESANGSSGYNIANQNVEVVYPSTGQTGPGNGVETTTYLYPGGPATSTQEFDESGSQKAQIQYQYGAEGELLVVEGSTQYSHNAYDGLYRLSSIADGNGNTTKYSYNAQGELATIAYPGNTGLYDSIQYTDYDVMGDPQMLTDGRGVVTNAVYNDPENNLTGLSYTVPPSSGIPAASNVQIAYDAYGRTVSESNEAAEYKFAYDDDDDLLTAQTQFFGPNIVSNIGYSYYPDGTESGMQTPAGTFSYDYDGAQRPTGLTNPYNETTSWAWANNNWLATRQLNNGDSTSYSYDGRGELTGLTNQYGNGSGTFSSFGNFTYDGVGNNTGYTATIPAFNEYNRATGYTYDSKFELTQETITPVGVNSQNPATTNKFSYDAAENPTVFRNATEPQYNYDNQVEGNHTLYDGDGNPTTSRGYTATFDVNNRMTQYGNLWAADYGPDGLRAWSSENNVKTYYVYDNYSTVPVCELSSTGAISAVNTVGVDGLISRYSPSSSSTFYDFDPQGNVADKLDRYGSVISSSETDAFGDVTSTQPATDPFGYEAQYGYYTDQPTGLILTTSRYYDPQQGRFLNRDPIGYDGGINLYDYTGNNPVNQADPSGKGPAEWFFGSGLAVEGAGAAADATIFGLPAGGVLAVSGVVLISIGGAVNAVNNGPIWAGSPPPNLSPPGSGRRGSFRQAKRDAGIPVTQHPDSVGANTGNDGKPQAGRNYRFKLPGTGGAKVGPDCNIREDAGGHNYGSGNDQNRGPHFNGPGGEHYDW